MTKTYKFLLVLNFKREYVWILYIFNYIKKDPSRICVYFKIYVLM